MFRIAEEPFESHATVSCSVVQIRGRSKALERLFKSRANDPKCRQFPRPKHGLPGDKEVTLDIEYQFTRDDRVRILKVVCLGWPDCWLGEDEASVLYDTTSGDVGLITQRLAVYHYLRVNQLDEIIDRVALHHLQQQRSRSVPTSAFTTAL